MARSKKSFDRELMYKKIMPTNLKKEGSSSESVKTENKEISIINKELNLIKDEKNEVILSNITEQLVLKKFDGVLKRMMCCRCNRCKQDIVALALNNLKPIYMAATRDEIEQKIQNLNDIGSKVTTELIKAVLKVRQNPRH